MEERTSVGDSSAPTKTPRYLPRSPTPQHLATVDTYLTGYQSLCVDRLLQPLGAEFRHRVHPDSLGVDEVDRTRFARDARAMFGMFREFHIAPRLIVDGVLRFPAGDGEEDRGARADNNNKTNNSENPIVFVHASMLGTLTGKISQTLGGSGEEDQGAEDRWENECVMIIRLSTDGTQVVRVDEFVDSDKAMKMKTLLAAATAGSAVSGDT